MLSLAWYLPEMGMRQVPSVHVWVQRERQPGSLWRLEGDPPGPEAPPNLPAWLRVTRACR